MHVVVGIQTVFEGNFDEFKKENTLSLPLAIDTYLLNINEAPALVLTSHGVKLTPQSPDLN